jgi:hypothetical protein
VKKALLLVVLCVSGLVPQQAKADYWFENTFRRADWVKENCSKYSGRLISQSEWLKRLGFKEDQGYAAVDLCRAYGSKW